MADLQMLSIFVKTAAEIIGFIEEGIDGLSRGGAEAEADLDASTYDFDSSRDSAATGAGQGIAPLFADETAAEIDCWPAVQDRAMASLARSFAERVRSSSSSVQMHGMKSAASTSISAGTIRAAPAAAGSKAWAQQMCRALNAHTTVLWLMQLRFQCSLRGVRPSELMDAASGFHDLQQLVLADEYGVASADSARNNPPTLSTREVHRLKQRRLEFLKVCVHRGVEYSALPGLTTAVYLLARRWQLPMDTVILIHATALLDVGSKDDEVEQLLTKVSEARAKSVFYTMDCLFVTIANSTLLLQVSDRGVIIDAVTIELRRRLGSIIIQIERLAHYGPLLAAMDPEAVAWARQGARTKASISTDAEHIGCLTTIPTEHADDNALVERFTSMVRRASSELKESRKAKDVRNASVDDVGILAESLTSCINVASTRHLIIAMQSILLSVPVQQRSQQQAPVPADAAVKDDCFIPLSWFDRKSRCDALLSLCRSLGQMSNPQDQQATSKRR